MIGKEQKLIITRKQISYKEAVINLDTENIEEDDVEWVGYMIIEALGVFLQDVRNVITAEDKESYNEYVKDLFEEVKKVLIHKYDNV